MKKIMITAVLAGIAGVAAAPFIVGTQIESATQKQAAVIDQQLKKSAKTNPYLTDAGFSIESYERSYANATARSLLTLATILPGDDGKPLVLEIPLNSEITHGPYLGESGFGLAKVISRLDIAAMDLPEVITADTFTLEDIIGFSGELDETLTIAPVTYDEGQGGFELGGLKAEIKTSLENRLNFTGKVAIADIKFSGAGKSNDGTFHLKPFTIITQGDGDSATSSGEYQLEAINISGESDKGLTLAIQRVTSSGSYKPAATMDLSLGEQELSLIQIEINDPATFPEPVIVPEFTFTSAIGESEQETVSFKGSYNATLSPGLMAAMQSPVNVKTVNIELGMQSLPVAILQAYMELAQSMAAPGQSAPDMAAMQEKLPELMRMVINSSTAGFIKVQAETDEGKLDTDIDVNFVADAAFSDEDAMTLIMSAGEDPAALLPYLAGKGQLHLDKSVTDAAGLTPMVQMMAVDFVKLDGEAFKSELLIKDGEILINGQPLPMAAAPPAGNAAFSVDDLSEAEKAQLKALMESIEAEAAKGAAE